MRGYRVLGRNVWAGGNELDLIVRRGRAVVFVEVKRKRGAGYGDPLEMVGPEKVRRVRRAAEAWLATHPRPTGSSRRSRSPPSAAAASSASRCDAA